MKYSENALNILAANTYKGIGKAWISKNITKYTGTNEIVSILATSAKESFDITIEDFEQRKNSLTKDLRKIEPFTDGLIAIGDEGFPPYRGNVKNSEQPAVIFYRGNIELLHKRNNNIAVIGLLEPDSEIENIERKVVSELVRSGATIVSGLALGCDTIAHEETLRASGRTIAIVPGSLDKIMPATNTNLANDIVSKNGLLITEYYNSAKSKTELKSRYQERDRLQALFSDAIILVASYSQEDKGKDSGSRLAMQYAFSYSTPRAVIYDKEESTNNNSMYNLNRQLFKEDKKLAIINPKNVRESLKEFLSLRPEIKTKTRPRQSLLDYTRS